MTPSLSISLSASGLKNIPHRDELDDIEFIIGDAYYQCLWFIADFFWPQIADLHRIDNMICVFVVETKDAKSEFREFLSLGRGRTIEIGIFESLREALEKAELSTIVYEREGGDPITIRIC
jgi:hypothetical protein